MSQCVPHWDVPGHRQDPKLADSLAQNMFLASKSRLCDHQQQQFCGRHESPEHVPDYNEVAELTWVNGHLALQGLVSKASNRHHNRSSGLACYWANDNHGHASAADARSAQNEKEVAARDNTNGSMNFSHFSRPAVMMKANLHVLGDASGPTNIQRVRQRCGYMDKHHTHPHQSRHRQQDAGNISASNANVPVTIVGSSNGLCTNSFAFGEISHFASLHIVKKASRSLPSQVISDDRITKALDQDRRQNYSMSGSASTIAKEMTSETCDAQDFTFTSTSRASPNNGTEKCGKGTRWKRKSRPEEDWGCQSEDVEDESAQPMKKPQARRSSSTKRSMKTRPIECNLYDNASDCSNTTVSNGTDAFGTPS